MSTSSSSAIIIGRLVLTPCPMSGFFAHSVTLPSAVDTHVTIGPEYSALPTRACVAAHVVADQQAAGASGSDFQEGSTVEAQ